MNEKVELTLNEDAQLDLENILNGTFSPLTGFMDSAEYLSVVKNMRLKNNQPWTIPITLEVPEQQLLAVKKNSIVILKNEKAESLAELQVSDIFTVDYSKDLIPVFKVDKAEHPGVQKEGGRSPYRVGGAVKRMMSIRSTEGVPYYSPEETKKYFASKGWKKIVGFQTRNPLHRAHEHLQRIGLEVADGLFIQPLIGWKKIGDFTAEAVMAAYKKMIEDFYPQDRVLLGGLKTPMRYAGPREAVFHAIIRRNHGCTHFIVGRDHAGVGNFYGKYEAQNLALQIKDLGIEILPLAGPFYCKKCQGIVTEKTCRHPSSHIVDVSGTLMREMLSRGEYPPEESMRKEISEVLLALAKDKKLFYGG